VRAPRWSEFLFLLGVIIVLLAILIPCVLAAQRASNERNASGRLKQMNSIQVTFKTNDFDGNSINDYWTADVSGLYHMTVSGAGKIRMIELEVALADGRTHEPYAGHRSRPKDDYWFQAMKGYETGKGRQPYYRTNVDRFSFIAYPHRYGRDGRLCFTVSEGGTMYKHDRRTECWSRQPRIGTPNPAGELTLENSWFPRVPADILGPWMG
jgi:hypothetical protein